MCLCRGRMLPSRGKPCGWYPAARAHTAPSPGTAPQGAAPQPRHGSFRQTTAASLSQPKPSKISLFEPFHNIPGKNNCPVLLPSAPSWVSHLATRHTRLRISPGLQISASLPDPKILHTYMQESNLLHTKDCTWMSCQPLLTLAATTNKLMNSLCHHSSTNWSTDCHTQSHTYSHFLSGVPAL